MSASSTGSTGQRLTDEQAQALTLRNVSLALSAGAGCGKTFILTERFLADLENQDDPQSLFRRVAITFTERAAREMRDRIRKATLNRLSLCPPDRIDYWQGILHGLDTARITTIHAFCAALLRTHAVETRLDPNFGLLDQQTTGTFLYKSASQTVRSRLIDQDSRVMDLVLHYGLEKTTGILVSLVSQRYRGDWKHFNDLTPDSLLEKWIHHFHSVFVPELLASLLQSPIVTRLFEVLQCHEPAHKVMQQRRDWLLEHFPRLPLAEDPVDHLRNIIEQAKVQGGGTAKAWPDTDIYETVRDGLKYIREEAAALIDKLDLNEDALIKTARLALAAVHLATEADRDYAAMKAQQGLLDFDDLLIKTRDLLAEHPDVRNRLQQGIELLMVDEFQDTDPLQAEIVRLLCGNDILDGKLFLVGDAKQSIYRFRRADPRVFHQFREEMYEQGRLPLSTNFRSQPAILNFVNVLFRPVMEKYESLQPFSEEQFSPPPCIEFLFAHPSAAETAGLTTGESSSEPDADDAAADNHADENADQLRKREADWIARRIRELLDDDTPRVRERDAVSGEMRLRRVQPGDIVLLFRGLTNVAVYEDALRNWGLDYYLVGGRAFYAQQEIYDVVNLLSYVDDPDDIVSLVGALRSPFFSLTDDTLLALSQQTDGWESFVTLPVPDGLPGDQREQVQRAKDVLGRLAGSKDRLSFVKLMETAFEMTGYDASLLHEFLGRRKLANLRKLIDLARSFDQAGVFTLKDFVRRLRTAVDDETDEEFAALHAEQTQIIRLMTIHQSKGLEFPVVFVAQMNWQPRGGRSQIYFHPEFGALLPCSTQIGEMPTSIAQHMHAHHEKTEDASEVVRLLYVAMTRAADHLILSAGFKQPPQGENKLSPWMSLLRDRFDLSTGLPAGDPYFGKLSGGHLNEEEGSTPEIPEIKVHHFAPEAKPPDGRESKTALPAEFAGIVDSSEPSIFPTLYGPVSVTAGTIEEFSVSAIVAAHQRVSTRSTGLSVEPPVVKTSVKDDVEPVLPSTELGTAMHLALEWIDLTSREPFAEQVSRVFSMQIPQPSEEIAHAVTRRLDVLQTTALWTELQTAQRCWRELDFLLSWPISHHKKSTTNNVIRGTIDCLFESAQGELVVRDYKTIPWNRSADAAALEHYSLQLGLYTLAVEQMFGRLPDRIELVFLGRHATQQAFVPTPQALSPLATQVDAALAELRSHSHIIPT